MTETRTVPRNVVDLLTSQHAEIIELFDFVRDNRGVHRADAFGCLIEFLAAHESAEHEVVHPIIGRVRRGADIAAERIREEDAIEAAMAELRHVGPDHEDFDDRLATVRQMVEAHIETEERDEFPLVRSQLDSKERHLMLERVRLAEGFAPTHSHPHGPGDIHERAGRAVSGADVVLGPFRAMAQTIRDAIHVDDERRARGERP